MEAVTNISLAALTCIVLLCRILGTHKVLRWPIFLVICVVIALEALAYAFVRLCIGVMSACAECRQNGKVGCASSYAEWLSNAEAADYEEGRDVWRDDPDSEHYDWRHMMATTRRLHTAREAGEWSTLMSLLLPLMKTNALGELEMSLYTRARAGTKRLIELYRDELCASLRALAHEVTALPPDGSLGDSLTDFSAAARASLGGAALVLSGGALFGVFHLGVIKALVDECRLPAVICGASAGAVVASIAATRTVGELSEILQDQRELYREMGSDGPFFGSLLWKVRRVLSRGRIYDFALWHKHMGWFSRGLTFREAYERTGRVLNIACTPLRSRGRRAPPLQLNHLSAPDVDIASAVCASACVPGLIEPVTLLEKGADGRLRPYHDPDAEDGRIALRDGSYESDVPLEYLSATFGSTFTIVSQVNPHVVPFYAHLRGRPGRPSGGRDHTGAWRGGFLLCALEIALKESLRAQLHTLRQLALLVDLFGVDWSNLWLQAQDGSVVLTPDLRPRHYCGVLSNVESPADLADKIRAMERATWEATALIRTRLDVDDALAALEAVCFERHGFPLGRGVAVSASRVPSRVLQDVVARDVAVRGVVAQGIVVQDVAAHPLAARHRKEPGRHRGLPEIEPGKAPMLAAISVPLDKTLGPQRRARSPHRLQKTQPAGQR